MKQKLVLFLGVSMMAFLLVGCKTEELEISSDVSEETSITAEADLTVEDTEESSENTLTSEEIENFEESVVPYPTEDVTPSAEDDFFTANNYTFKQYGYYEFISDCNHWLADGSKEADIQTLTGSMDYIVADNGDGTKTYTITDSINPYVYEDGGWTGGHVYYIVGDRYTGKVQALDAGDTIEITNTDGSVVNITYGGFDAISGDATTPTIVNITVTVPTDYDGLVIGKTGYNDDISDSVVWDTEMMADEALTGNSELLWWAFPE